MKSITSIDALTWFGGLAAQTFLKAFLILMLLNGIIDLVVIRTFNSISAKYIVGAGLAVCLFLAWVYLLWKTEPLILPRSILAVAPLIIGIGAFIVTGSLVWWLVVIIGYTGGVIWMVYFRAPALRVAIQQWRAGNTERALEVLDRYIELHPSAGEAYQYRAWFRLDRAQYLKAEQDIKTVLQLKPRSYFSQYLSGRILLEKGHFGEAKDAFKSAVRLGPGRGISYLSLGLIYHLEGEHLLAVEALCNGIGWGLPNKSNYLVAYYYIGRELDGLGQSSLAERAYKLMGRYWKGYDVLVTAIHTDSNPETPTSKMYLADLSDIERHLNLAVKHA